MTIVNIITASRFITGALDLGMLILYVSKEDVDK